MMRTFKKWQLPIRSQWKGSFLVVWFFSLLLLGSGTIATASYTITKNEVNVTINGDNTTDGSSDYTFTLSGATAPVTEINAIIKTSYPANLNIWEGITTVPKMFPAQVATDHSPGITIVPDESPWGMDYMRIISSCSTNGSCYNQWSYKDLMNQNITPTISQMPTTISLWFWLKDSTVNTVFSTDWPDIWINADAYSGSNDYTRKNNLPIKSALDSSSPIPITFMDANKYQSYTATLSKLAQQSWWTFYVLIIDNIIYKPDYVPSNPSFYITFNAINTNSLFPNGATIEMANLSLLFDSTMGPEYPWVNTVEGNIRLDFDPHETNFTIPQDKIAGDITISAGAYQDSTLSTTNGAIDINPFASAESNTVKPFTLALNGNEITSIISPTKTLVEGTDYTFDGTTFAFTDLFLAGLSLGANIITFNMTHGIAPIYEIIVTNSDNGQGALQFTLNSDILLVKTAFNDSTNIIQQFLMPRVLPTANGPFDMQGVKQVANTNIGMNTDWAIVLAGGGDEATPFLFNSSYIGANHGFNQGQLITTILPHGKTYADIGSVWQDLSGNEFYLLRIESDTQLLFFSKNYGSSPTKTAFRNITGTTLTHVEQAIHTDAIAIGSNTNTQVNPAIWHTKSELRAYRNDQKTKILPSNTIISADYIEIYEYYDIANPGLIGPTLQVNRPVGWYSSNPNLAENVPAIMHYKAIHKITADGALVTTVNHEFVGEVNMSYYGIIQYNNKSDAFGGGLWKYIPKTLPLNDPAYDFSIPFNMANLVATAYIRKTDWIHPTDVPNRDITYYKNGSNEIVAGFAAGYLPLLDGTNDKLLENLTNTSSFIYTSKKDYPYFTQKNNLTIQGVAYRTYFPVDSIKLHTSSVLVPYEDTYYYYLDYHTTGSETIQLPTELNNKSPILIEKSSNVLYEYSSPNNLNITVGTTTGNNSYLVLKFEITNNGGNGNWNNNGGSSSWWGGGGSSASKDSCPNGDFSSSYYDWICGMNPTTNDKVGTGQALSDKDPLTNEQENTVSSVPTIPDDEILSAYDWAFSHNITTLAPIANANPDGTVIREHLAKMVVNYALNALWRTLPEKVPSQCHWKDGANAWESQEMKEYAVKACSLGLMGIDMDYFQPYAKVSRAQFGTVLSRLLRQNTYAGGKPYYVKHLEALQQNWIMTQIDTPESRIELRQRVRLMLMRSAK